MDSHVTQNDRPPGHPVIVAIAAFVAAVGVLFVLVGSGVLGRGLAVSDGRSLVWLGLTEVAVGVAILAWSRWRRRPSRAQAWRTSLAAPLIAWNAHDGRLTFTQRARALVLVSALGLFLELVLIRLLGAEIKVFAFLKNVVLLGAFLGLGLGFFLAR